MENQELLEVLLTPEFIVAIGTALSGIFGVALRFVNKRITGLTVENTEFKMQIKTLMDTITDKDESIDESQSLNTKLLSQISDLSGQISSLNTLVTKLSGDLDTLRKKQTDDNNTIMQLQNQVKLYEAEIKRLQPFEGIVTQRNGEIANLTKELNTLKHKVAILEAREDRDNDWLGAFRVSIEPTNNNQKTTQQ